ncbi:MAG TPA: hypothetical protein VGR73_04390 [Bryobacteraceae bacterium]|nr:hypothetical protein [Bryobacteraceae bacterium]
MSVHEHLSHKHLSDDVLIDALYGLADPSGPADVDARVRECPVCAFRWNQLLEMRAAITVPLETGAAELAAQRRKIYDRIEHPSRMRWAGPAAAAAACLIAIGVLIHRPAAPVRPEIDALINDTQLSSGVYSDVYSDVYSMEQSFEPSAAVSLGALFESDAAQAERANQSSNQGVNQ